MSEFVNEWLSERFHAINEMVKHNMNGYKYKSSRILCILLQYISKTIYSNNNIEITRKYILCLIVSVKLLAQFIECLQENPILRKSYVFRRLTH